MKRKSVRLNHNSIQFKILAIVALMMAIMLSVNLFLYRQMGSMMQRVDSVYTSNVEISDISDCLSMVHSSVYEYLNTRSSRALENYYRYSQQFEEDIQSLNDRNVDDEVLMLEKNVRSMSETYLEMADTTIQAKRGRNVEGYRESFDDVSSLYHYINYYIYELDSRQFAKNSESYEILLSTVNVLEVFSMIVMVLICAISVIMAYVIVRSMVRPLHALADTAIQVASGNMDVRVPAPVNNDEVGIVSAAFAKMLDSIRDYIRKVREGLAKEAELKERELAMEANLKDAQLKYLQAQINPHFLFNSLNAGAQLATMEDAEQTSSFLQRMSDFYRYNVKKTNGVSTLGEEIEAVSNYIYILNVRFAGDINYETRVEPGLEGVQIPTLCLQPVVENAVTHGIRDIMGHGRITLTAEKSEPFIQVTVADNGAGMTQAQISEILEKGRETYRDEDIADGHYSTGIGLVNVIRRLNLFYDQENLLGISSEGKGMGTEVTLLLPLSAGAADPDGI